MRLGDLGALDASWDGWVLNRNGLWSPDGKRYSEGSMRLWWLTSEQARFWRQGYDARNCVTRYENRDAAVAASAAERLEGASRGAAVQHLTGESLSCPAPVKPGRATAPFPGHLGSSVAHASASAASGAVRDGASTELDPSKTKAGTACEMVGIDRLQTALSCGFSRSVVSSLTGLGEGPNWGHNGAILATGGEHVRTGEIEPAVTSRSAPGCGDVGGAHGAVVERLHRDGGAQSSRLSAQPLAGKGG